MVDSDGDPVHRGSLRGKRHRAQIDNSPSDLLSTEDSSCSKEQCDARSLIGFILRPRSGCDLGCFIVLTHTRDLSSGLVVRVAVTRYPRVAVCVLAYRNPPCRADLSVR